MEIIDKKTGKRIIDESKKINKALKKSDPIKRNAEKDKGLEDQENSPMDPPDVYDPTPVEGVTYHEMSPLLERYMDEHKAGKDIIDGFEKGLIKFREEQYKLNDEINTAFSEFFQFFDDNILDHNRREERQLFPLLHQRLIESGEKGDGDEPQTAVDMMEDDHVKFIQLASLSFNLLGLAARLPDAGSKMFVYDVAFSNGQELIEMLRLHIFREDTILAD